MANKREAREPRTKPVVWARFEAGTAWFYVDPDRPGMNKRVGFDTKLDTVG